MSAPNSTGPIEVKVWASTAGALLMSVLLAVFTAVQGNPDILFGLPSVVQFLVIAILPPLITFAAGFQAPHTQRNDADAQR